MKTKVAQVIIRVPGLEPVSCAQVVELEDKERRVFVSLAQLTVVTQYLPEQTSPASDQAIGRGQHKSTTYSAG